MVLSPEKIIEQTTNWIKSVVIDCNFCPFAAKAILKKSVRYIVKSNIDMDQCLDALKEELLYLETDPETETSFIILSQDFKNFDDYLDLVEAADNLLVQEDFDGIYQIASFHPDYCFEGSNNEDPANYTNRSIYPMLHILREDSLTKALSLYPHPEKIPQDNIEFARQRGLQYMQLLRSACM
ncbi:MAG: hypothetical protein K0S53_875 [Bacteroidetes bacterium]|jgi:hypothetical protein|nr:hypothetical protein [Bacteroidota bacterium]MDF2450783.1 hypothetical protein [Bacteroidota bacterium]